MSVSVLGIASRAHPKVTLEHRLALLFYPPHAILMRLHGRGSYVVILIPETADLLGLREVAGLVGRIRQTGLTTMRTEFSLPLWEI